MYLFFVFYLPEGGHMVCPDMKKIKNIEQIRLSQLNKGKGMLVQAWTGPEGSRLPDFKTIGT